MERAVKARQPSIRQLQRILGATQLLNSTLELGELAGIILQIVRDELGVDRASVFRVDRDTGMLHSIAAQDVGGNEITFPIGTGIAGSVAARNEIIDIPDAYSDERFNPEFDRTLGFRTKDIYCVPVTNRTGTVVGVIQLLNRSHAFTAEDCDFVASLAVHIGLAVEQAFLYQQVTEKRQLELELSAMRDQLAEVEKMSLMGELVAGIVHEIRNPLSVLSAHTTFLKEETAAYPQFEDRIEKISLATRRVLAVVQDFLSFVRKKGDARESVPVNDVIQEMLRLLSHEWKANAIEVTTELARVPPVIADTGQIQHVLMNIFKNAADAMRPAGTGHLCVRSTHDTAKNVVRIDIEDDGPGVPADLRDQIFEPFITTKPRGAGTGLGLSVSRRIILSYDGSIYLRDAARGATFSIELPAAARQGKTLSTTGEMRT